MSFAAEQSARSSGVKLTDALGIQLMVYAMFVTLLLLVFHTAQTRILRRHLHTYAERLAFEAELDVEFFEPALSIF